MLARLGISALARTRCRGLGPVGRGGWAALRLGPLDAAVDLIVVVVRHAIVGKFAVVALKDLTNANDMLLYVSVDAEHWAKAHFPHASSARLRENGYTIVESTRHSLGVDVLLQLDAAGLTVYKRDLEPVVLDESTAYYKAEGERLLETCDAPEYLRRVSSFISAVA